MSWLSEIAGKAENFLNAMDKGAASAISHATNVVQQQQLSKSSTQSSRKYSIKSDLDYGHDAEFIET